jgi:hypothetical protein
MAETLNTRVTRLEKTMTELAASQVRLTNAQAHFAEVQAQGEGQIREMKKEALERERRVDERIDKLVSAIGEFTRKNGKS